MELADRSAFAHVLFLSGVLGIAAAMGLSGYRALLADPVFLGGQRVVPVWVEPAFLSLLGGSLAVVVYALVLDEVLAGWLDLATGAALLGQWGLPLGWALSETGASAGPTGLVVPVAAAMHVLVALAVLVGYVRRVWPGV